MIRHIFRFFILLSLSLVAYSCNNCNSKRLDEIVERLDKQGSRINKTNVGTFTVKRDGNDIIMHATFNVEELDFNAPIVKDALNENAIRQYARENGTKDLTQEDIEVLQCFGTNIVCYMEDAHGNKVKITIPSSDL